MAITVDAILGWCRAPANTRVEVIASLMPGGMNELADFSVDEIKEATKSFSRLRGARGFFIVTSHHETTRATNIVGKG
jgi:hypothetical protein